MFRGKETNLRTRNQAVVHRRVLAYDTKGRSNKKRAAVAKALMTKSPRSQMMLDSGTITHMTQDVESLESNSICGGI